MSSCSVGTEIIKITSVLYTCALIGQYPCLDQSIQTRTFPMHQKFFLNNYCGYFIKNGFLCLDTLIVMLLDFRKAKNVSCFFTLFSILLVLQHPVCLDQSIQHGKPWGISLRKHCINDYVVGIPSRMEF